MKWIHTLQRWRCRFLSCMGPWIRRVVRRLSFVWLLLVWPCCLSSSRVEGYVKCSVIRRVNKRRQSSSSYRGHSDEHSALQNSCMIVPFAKEYKRCLTLQYTIKTTNVCNSHYLKSYICRSPQPEQNWAIEGNFVPQNTQNFVSVDGWFVSA